MLKLKKTNYKSALNKILQAANNLNLNVPYFYKIEPLNSF
jgi:hypothetical protein